MEKPLEATELSHAASQALGQTAQPAPAVSPVDGDDDRDLPHGLSLGGFLQGIGLTAVVLLLVGVTLGGMYLLKQRGSGPASATAARPTAWEASRPSTEPSDDPDDQPQLQVRVVETTIATEKTVPRSFRIAVTSGPLQYDDVGQLLRQLGDGYKYTTTKLEDLEEN